MTTITANQPNTKSIHTNADFDHIIAELNDKETVLKVKQDDLVKALDQASKQLENVRSAIIALSGQSPAKSLNEATKQRKQTVDGKTVLKLVCNVLKGAKTWEHDTFMFGLDFLNLNLRHYRHALLAKLVTFLYFFSNHSK